MLGVGSPTEVPLADDSTGRFVPWIVGGMVFLAALALVAALTVSGAASRWKGQLAGSATVQIRVTADQPAPKNEAQVTAALTVLRNFPGVVSAEPVSEEAARALVAPWLGEADLPDLPLPRLIDVTIDPDLLDSAALRQALVAEVPDILYDDHLVWVRGLVSLARSLELVAFAVLVLVGTVAVLTIIFTTRSALAIHHGVVEVLHLIGAQDPYIAGGFARHAAGLALRGGIGGAALAAAAIGMVETVGAGSLPGLLTGLRIGWYSWVAVACLPPLTAGLAAFTARRTVMSALNRMS